MARLKTIFLLIFLFSLGMTNAQQTVPPKYEYRAVWLTVIENLDWPVTQAVTPSSVVAQKQELIHLLDSFKTMNINTVLLQTRVRGDLIYPSSIEPFSHLFTGEVGKFPGYDPLAFAIEECHKRGIQLHAWIVAMPLGKDEHIELLGNRALPHRNRSLTTHFNGAWYMEPGNPKTSNHIVSIVKEVVEKYDIDGIHLDYIRYPDSNESYPDKALYRKYGRGLTLAAWRRSNITRIVKDVYSCVKSIKPWVRVSCATLGKYDNLTRYSSLGWDALNTGFQEAQEWMRNGIVDIIFPMLYFKGKNFYPFVRDWQENACGCHVVPGIGAYRLLPEYGGWNSLELLRQLNTSRSAGTAGTAMFRAEHLVNCAGDIYRTVYRTKALVPSMEWYGTKPLSPESLVVEETPTGITLRWSGMENPKGTPAVSYNIYSCMGDELDITNVENLLASMLSATSFTLPGRVAGVISFAVTSVDAYGVESEPVRVTFTPKITFGKEIFLPSYHSPGMKIEITDVYGRRLYYEAFTKSIKVDTFDSGCYVINIYDSSGGLVQSFCFVAE